MLIRNALIVRMGPIGPGGKSALTNFIILRRQKALVTLRFGARGSQHEKYQFDRFNQLAS